MNKIELVCVIIGCLVLGSIYLWVIVKDIKASRRIFPYGKVAKENFIDNVDEILHANNLSKKEIYLYTKYHDFKVKIVEEKVIGLEYCTIPVYSGKKVYINDEHVATVHSMRTGYNKYLKHIELSLERKKEEIEELVTAAGKIAKEISHDYCKENKIFPDEKSFFNDEEN